MLTIYISGPITNNPHYEEEFANAEIQLNKAGYYALNPVTINNTDDWHTCMRNDIKALMDCDGIAMLKGWKQSKGAKIEHQLAQDLNMPVRPIERWLDPNNNCQETECINI